MSVRYRLPARYGPPLFSGLLSGSMCLLVSGIAAWRAIGLGPDFATVWINAWLAAWPIAFAALMVVSPAVRRVVDTVVEPRSPAARQSPPTGAEAR